MAPMSGQAAGVHSPAHRCVSWERALHVEPCNEARSCQATVGSMLPCGGPSPRKGVVFELIASTTVLLGRLSMT